MSGRYFAICVNCKSYKGKVAFRSCRINREHVAGDWNRVAFPIGAKVFFKDLPYTVQGYQEATILIVDDDGVVQPVSLHNARRLVVVQLPSLTQQEPPVPRLHGAPNDFKINPPLDPTSGDAVRAALAFTQSTTSAQHTVLAPEGADGGEEQQQQTPQGVGREGGASVNHAHLPPRPSEGNLEDPADPAEGTATTSGRTDEPECVRCRAYQTKMAELNALVAHLAGENLTLKQQLAYYVGKQNTSSSTTSLSAKRKAAAGADAAKREGAASPRRSQQAPTGMAEAVLALTTLGDGGSGHQQVQATKRRRTTKATPAERSALRAGGV
mmetsp:Transcript_15387/g.33267  ORF Transcript_15387/g.33267 Transcript_15387/m.33267 type:complete len:326 (-) Transcript_15387:316-1293(-)